MSLHLLSFSVKGLFSSFSYTIELNQKEGVTIITAPNGYGKTAILRLINAFFTKNWLVMGMIEFEEVVFSFTDNISIGITQIQKKEDKFGLIFKALHDNNCEDFEFLFNSYTPEDFPISLIDEVLPHLDRIGPRRWLDMNKNEALTFDELWDQEGKNLIKLMQLYGYTDKIYSKSKYTNVPPWLDNIIGFIECRFIETQRLLDISPIKNHPHRSRRAVKPISVVEMYAEELKNTLQQDLAKFTTTSQELDRTFPNRVITPVKSEILVSDLQEQMNKLETKRKELIAVGILDTSEGYLPIPIEKADESTLNILKIYVDDNMTKLNVFDELYKKVAMFLDIVNRKFESSRAPGAVKKVKCNKDYGLVVESDPDKNVDLSSLSSGEQHELVLFYDIIFKMGKNTLLLIDEPELSLHVSWQKKFVPDLLEIIATNDMRVLLATHSPQIINDRRDLRVSLGVE